MKIVDMKLGEFSFSVYKDHECLGNFPDKASAEVFVQAFMLAYIVQSYLRDHSEECDCGICKRARLTIKKIYEALEESGIENE